MSFQLGERVKDYEFVDLLDATGSSETYEVFNHAEDRREILKVLPREVQRDRQAVDRFLREAKIHARLSHPAIAGFYGGMQLAGQLVMTFEAVDGVPLENRLKEGPFSLEESLSVCKQTLDALEYSHERTVVHRDVTPRNIVVADDGAVKLTGFELAKQATDQTLTRQGEMLGSAHYMSPEQVKGVASIDARSDIYSLGIVLYEMVTGTKPFDSRSQFEIFQAHVLEPPPALEVLRDELPSSLSSTILRSLEKEPDDRFPNAESFRDSLDAIAAEVRELEGRPTSRGILVPVEDLGFDDSGELVEMSQVGLTRQEEPEEEPERESARSTEKNDETAAAPEQAAPDEGKDTREPVVPAWKKREWVMVCSVTAVIIIAIIAVTIFTHGG